MMMMLSGLFLIIWRPSISRLMSDVGVGATAQTVEAPTLSLLVPLLVRGLAERATAIRRKTAVIIDNMAKLVDSPHDAAVFLPRLLPGLKNMSAQVPLPPSLLAIVPHP